LIAHINATLSPRTASLKVAGYSSRRSIIADVCHLSDIYNAAPSVFVGILCNDCHFLIIEMEKDEHCL
jgi:hypothetical protein